IHPSGEHIEIEASDKQNIVVVRLKTPMDSNAKIVEITGTVDGRNQIVCDSCVAFTDEQCANFDMDVYNQAVMLFNHFKDHYIMTV
ncbi:unnamed protein product, partial [Didymodactylos carnosus]